MKVKLKDHVIHSGEVGAGKHLKKGETHDLPEPVAQGLIKRDLATAVPEKKEPAAPEKTEGDKTPPPPPPKK